MFLLEKDILNTIGVKSVSNVCDRVSSYKTKKKKNLKSQVS